MALSKLEPDREKVEKIALRMKEIIETIWGRDSGLNGETGKEFQFLKKELEDMGLYVTYKARINLKDPTDPRIEADIDVLIPINTTIQ